MGLMALPANRFKLENQSSRGSYSAVALRALNRSPGSFGRHIAPTIGSSLQQRRRIQATFEAAV
jgi:hypothetical protein